MTRKHGALDENADTAWSTMRAQIVLPPCDRVPVTCSYALSSDKKAYVGFIRGRLGLFSRFHSPLAIYRPGGIVHRVTVTSFGDGAVSFRVARGDWIVEDAVPVAPKCLIRAARHPLRASDVTDRALARRAG